MLKYMDQARQIGVKTISFSGGEPFVYPSFRDLLWCALSLGYRVELVTNGLLITESDLGLLERCKCVTVSVDGPAEIHDFIRGKQGAWSRTMKTLALFARSRVCWGTNTVVQRANAGFLEETWRAICSQGRPSYVGFTQVEVIPETVNLQPDPQQLSDAKAQLSAIQMACEAEHIHFNEKHHAVGDSFEVFADKSRRFRPLGGCNIPSQFLGISYYGIFPCWHQGRWLPHGNLIEALESPLCRQILHVARSRTCVGCNASNYSWNEEWSKGILAAFRAGEWSEGVVPLAISAPENGDPWQNKLPIIVRGLA